LQDAVRLKAAKHSVPAVISNRSLYDGQLESNEQQSIDDDRFTGDRYALSVAAVIDRRSIAGGSST